MGQKQTRRNQMVMSALPPKADFSIAVVECPLWAKTRHCKLFLFDDLVRLGGEAGRHLDAERLGSLEVDEQLELGRLHHRQVPELLTLENPAHVDAG